MDYRLLSQSEHLSDHVPIALWLELDQETPSSASSASSAGFADDDNTENDNWNSYSFA